MTKLLFWLTGIIAVVLAVAGGVAWSAQDKYSLRAAEWARFLRIQGIRKLAGGLRQSDGRPAQSGGR